MLYFDENVITGDPEILIEVRHLKIKGSNREIGRKLSEIARERHGVQLTTKTDPLRNRCQRIYLQKNYPIHYQRMLGIADTYGMDINDDGIDFSLLGKPNLGTCCSAVYYPPNYTALGHGIMSRNLVFFTTASLNTLFDLNPEAEDVSALSRPYIVEIYPEQGYPSLTIISFELFGEALDGMNSEGLVVAHLADGESLEPIMSNAVGFNELKCIQFLLDTCADVNEAKQALLTNKHYYSFTPVHLFIGDRHGNSFVWEYSHAHNKEYMVDGNGKPQIVTNFLLHRYQNITNLPRVSNDQGCYYNRYRILHDAITNCEDQKFDYDFMKETNALVFMTDRSFLKQPPMPLRTIMHSVYDTIDRSLQISFHLRDEANPQIPGQITPVHSQYYRFGIE